MVTVLLQMGDEMKIGRNDLCYCGSGKKYKHCCLKRSIMSEYDLIRNVIEQEGYDREVSDFISSLYQYMKENQWMGACHATSSIMYVGFCELGYSPTIYIGEVAIPTRPRFDHSWITVDEKVIDLAIAMPLPENVPISNPIVFDINIATNQKHQIIYGVKGGRLDREASSIFNTSFVDYMDMFPMNVFPNSVVVDGLWGILKRVFPYNINITEIKKRYDKVMRVKCK